MATEYKLSYTATEIDEKLGMVDSMVKTVNGVTPDESGNAEVDLTGYATEEFVNSAIAANNIIQPLPIKEKEFTTAVAKYYVDIEQLENNVCYGLTTIPEEEKRNSIRVYYRIYCEDGTFKNVSLTQANYVYSALKAGNNISLMCYMPSSINTEYKVDITDKSTANNVVVTTIYNRDFLGINNTREFIPTNDYQPATKKYVDDAIAALRAELTATTE